MLYIRADANLKIGTGHIMRCLAIASAAKKQGIDSAFIASDKESKNIVLSHGFAFICLDSYWNRLDDELEKLTNLIQSLRISRLLIDTYYVTENYLNNVKKYTKVIYMDDINQFVYPVDILINYNIYASNFNYGSHYNLDNTTLLSGCEFAPLREEFQDKRANIVEKITDVLITTGGSDAYNVAGNLIQYLNEKNQYNNIKFHIVVGSFNVHAEKLKVLAKKYNNVLLHSNVTRISELMIECDLAVSAGGSTLYELCSCGIPTISFSFADNQLEGVHEFHRKKLIYYAGDVRNGMIECLNEIENNMKKMILDSDLRKELSTKMMDIVDGYGANRIIKYLKYNDGGNIYVKW